MDQCAALLRLWSGAAAATAGARHKTDSNYSRLRLHSSAQIVIICLLKLVSRWDRTAGWRGEKCLQTSLSTSVPVILHHPGPQYRRETGQMIRTSVLPRVQGCWSDVRCPLQILLKCNFALGIEMSKVMDGNSLV